MSGGLTRHAGKSGVVTIGDARDRLVFASPARVLEELRQTGIAWRCAISPRSGVPVLDDVLIAHAREIAGKGT